MSTERILRDHIAQRRAVRDLALENSDLRGAQLPRLRADGLDLQQSDKASRSACAPR